MAADTQDKTVHETLLSSHLETFVVENETNESRNYRRLVLVLGGVILCLTIAVGLLCFLLGASTPPPPAVQTTPSFCPEGQDCQTASTHGPVAKGHNQNQTVASNTIQTTTAQSTTTTKITTMTTTKTTTATNQTQGNH